MKKIFLIPALFGLLFGTKMYAQNVNWCINLCNYPPCTGNGGDQIYVSWGCDLNLCPGGCGDFIGGPFQGPFTQSGTTWCMSLPAGFFDPSTNPCFDYSIEIINPCNGNTYIFTLNYVSNDIYAGWVATGYSGNQPNHITFPFPALSQDGSGNVTVNIYDDTNGDCTGTPYNDY
jgi:hypothetical protein